MNRAICCQIDVSASRQTVWEAWTTSKAAEFFFAPQAHIEARPGGSYELYFNPTAPVGQRGSEGMHMLTLQEPGFLSFTWNAPPHLPTVRGQQTFVEIHLKEIEPSVTRVLLRHGGWGKGSEWDAAYDYFKRAWGKIVLPRLKYYLENGPIDWSNPPQL